MCFRSKRSPRMALSALPVLGAVAAEILGQRPEAMQLRYLSTLNVIAGERSSTIAFPFPLDFIDMLAYRTDDAGRQGQGSRVLCQHVV